MRSDDDQPAVSELQKELEEVREEATVTKEQLSNYKESCSKLEEALKVCNLTKMYSEFNVIGDNNDSVLFFLGKNCNNRETPGPI